MDILCLAIFLVAVYLQMDQKNNPKISPLSEALEAPSNHLYIFNKVDKSDRYFLSGLNICAGQLANAAVGAALDIPVTAPEQLLAAI